MLQSLKIGSYIFNRIHDITGYDCYPCIADNDVKFPYIVYNRTGLSTELTKDGYTQDNVSFEISVYSDKYAQSIIVANAVRSALEVLSAQHDETFDVDNSVITNASEYWNDNTFVQQINWTADVTRYIDESGLYIDPSELNVLLEVSRTSGPSETKIIEYTDEMPEQHTYNIKVGESVVFPVLNRVYFEHGLKQKTVEYPDAYYRDSKVEVDWTSSDTNIVEIKENGLLCKTKGEATIQANYQDRYYVDVPVNVTNASKYILDINRSEDKNNFRVRRYKSYTEDAWGIQITPFTENDIDYVRVTGIAPTAHYQNVEWQYYDDILPGWAYDQSMFKIFNVEEGKPEPTYDTYLVDDATFTRNGVQLIVNGNSELEGSLNVESHFSGGAFVVTNQLATDDTFTSFTKGLESSAYYSLPGLHSGMHKTITSPVSTFVDNYNFSKVDHVDLALEICMEGHSLSAIRINGVDLLPYIEEQYGSDWASTVNWTPQTIKIYDYLNDTSYKSHNVNLSCCYLELTGLPVEIITNYNVADKYTGISHSNGNDSALLYNFKLIEKQA